MTFSSIGKIAACITIIGLSHRLISLRVTKEFCRKEHVGLAVIGSVLERFYHPILEKAKKDNIPVLDLANLFNPYQVDLYHFPWVPSIKGGTVIADHLADIIKNYNSRKPTEELLKNWTITTS